MAPSKEAFETVSKELEANTPLTLEMVGKVFGPEFYMLIIYCLLDSGDAARAIQGAIMRLSKGEMEKEIIN
jgi:hypothetical protein